MEQLNKAERRMRRITERNELIKQMYDKLSSERVGSARKFSQAAIIVLIADKYFLSEKTVDNIICNRLNYKTKNRE